MSIFSLVKGEKEHGVFEMRMFGGEVLNRYIAFYYGICYYNNVKLIYICLVSAVRHQSQVS